MESIKHPYKKELEWYQRLLLESSNHLIDCRVITYDDRSPIEKQFTNRAASDHLM